MMRVVAGAPTPHKYAGVGHHLPGWGNVEE